MDKETRRVLDDVARERERQTGLFGIQEHTPERWLAILGEEYGEACRAHNDMRWPGEGKRPATVHDIRAELIHVAAVAVQAVENIDRGAVTNCGDCDFFGKRGCEHPDAMPYPSRFTLAGEPLCQYFKPKDTKPPKSCINCKRRRASDLRMQLIFCMEACPLHTFRAIHFGSAEAVAATCPGFKADT